MSPLYARIVAALIPDKQLRGRVRDLLLGRTDWLVNLLRTEPGINYMAMAVNRLPLHDLVKNYALIGDMLEILKPYDCIGVVKSRIGNKNDGGYVMIAPRQEEKIAYSFGVSNESPWDLEMATQGLKVYQYDGTIESPPDKHPNLFFHRNNISAPSNSTPYTKNITQIFNELGHGNEKDIILQIDIEGAEWSFFEEIEEEDISKFSQIIIEWHGLSPTEPEFQRRLDILRKVARTHTPIHVHVNNYGFGNNIPKGMLFYGDAFEVSYVRSCGFQFKPSTEFYPTQLDTPCNTKWPDVPIGKWPEQ